MTKVSVVIHAYNEEKTIRRCLESVDWADEIIFVDTYSTDRTPEIAQEYTERVLKHKYRNSAETKNWAMGSATCPWVFFLDADEVVDDQLRGEIQSALRSDDETAGYLIEQELYFWGIPLKSTNWNPNWGVRLFKRDSNRWEDKEVHSKPIIHGSVKKLRGKINHYSYPNLASLVTKLNRFTTFESRQRGTHPPLAAFPAVSVLRSVVHFLRLYVRARGYRDGRAGFILAVIGALYPFLTDAKYWERSHGLSDYDADIQAS